MIVACPQCATRFAVDDKLLGGDADRRVRCANCGETWHPSRAATALAASADTAAAEPATAVVASAAAIEAAPQPRPGNETEPALASREAPLLGETSPAAPEPLARPSVAAEPAAQRHRSVVWAAALGAAALAAALVLAVILGRDRIETVFPATMPLYAMLHLDAPGAGLKVTVVPIRRADALVISGDIVNDAQAPRQVPRLRLTLLDANRADLVSKVIDPPVARLQPGARAHFDTVFEHPANGAVRVDVTYAKD